MFTAPTGLRPAHESSSRIGRARIGRQDRVPQLARHTVSDGSSNRRQTPRAHAGTDSKPGAAPNVDLSRPGQAGPGAELRVRTEVPVRVLVAEDTQQLAEALADGLRGQAMAVDVVFDGQAAQESLAVNDYDVVILDRDLPVVHGDEVCRSLAAGIRLDPVRHQASRHGRTLSLRHKEFLVLEELLLGGGAVV